MDVSLYSPHMSRRESKCFLIVNLCVCVCVCVFGGEKEETKTK